MVQMNHLEVMRKEKGKRKEDMRKESLMYLEVKNNN